MYDTQKMEEMCDIPTIAMAKAFCISNVLATCIRIIIVSACSTMDHYFTTARASHELTYAHRCSHM